MTFRISNAEQLAQCSPAVRAQLEKHFAGELAKVAEVSPKLANTIEELDARHAPRTKMARPEQDAGAALVKWIDLVQLPNGLRPGQFFYHVANGGSRDKVEAGVLKGQGVRKGWPDYGLDLPAGAFHGLRLELKAPNGAKPPIEQLEILARLESVGFKCCVAWGFEEAREYVEQYLDLYQRTTPAGAEARRPAPGGVPAHE